MNFQEKYLLTIKEASEYFNIGQDKLYRLAKRSLNGEIPNFVLMNGTRYMIRRKNFEDYLDASEEI